MTGSYAKAGAHGAAEMHQHTILISLTSPYARKLRAIVIEKGLQSQCTMVVTPPMEDPPELHRVNPLGKIPALLRDDGFNLVDSALIAEYLDTLGAGVRLIPAETEARFRVLRMAQLGHGLMDAAVARLLEMRRDEATRSPMWLMRHTGAITRTLAVLEEEAGSLSQMPTLAEINVAVALGYLDFRHDDLRWRLTHPKLATWFEVFSQRASIAETVPPAGA